MILRIFLFFLIFAKNTFAIEDSAVVLMYHRFNQTDLSSTNMNGVNLSGANLTDVWLYNANLQFAKLNNADLSGATFFTFYDDDIT